MKILVTGATGFIGSHLVERLAREGHNVRALVRKHPRNPSGMPGSNSEGLLKELGIEIFYGDLLDRKSLEKAMEGIDVVFHLAAIARPMAIPKEMYYRVNEAGTRNLMEACRNKKLKKIIVMSSISAVGPSRNSKPVNENTPCHPIDEYGRSKLAAEKIAMHYSLNYDMPIVMLRPPMVFGPRDFEMLRLFKAVNRRFFPIKGNKNGLTEFLYVENLVDACLLAWRKGKNGNVYHITNGKSYTIDEIVNAISKAQDVKVLPIKFPYWSFIVAGYFMEGLGKIFRFHPPFKHDTIRWMTTKFWYSNPAKAKKELGYKAKIGLDEGIRRTVRYYKKKGLL